MKIILGIQEAHDASAALMVDGEIIAAVQEERFSGLKCDYGYPQKSIDACLNTAGVDPSQIDVVALASHNWNPVLTKIKRNANFTVDDWVKEQHDFWKPTLFENKVVNYYNIYKNRKDFSYDNTYSMDHLLNGYMEKAEMEQMAAVRKETVARLLGLPAQRIVTVTHEDCHAFYAYYGSHIRGEALVLTSEGIGDFSNGTVSVFAERENRLLAHSSDNHLGHIYQYITLLLGMKPSQHEYKVMGLAPYANTKEQERSYCIFKDILNVDGLNITWNKKPSDLYFHFRDAFEGHRFDGIAGGLQQFVEVLLCDWVRACIEETDIHRVCFSGGVAQNIKANMQILNLSEIEDFFVCPAAGDTSLPLGACYYVMCKFLKENGGSMDMLQPLKHAYLGPEFSTGDVETAIKAGNIGDKYSAVSGVTPDVVANELASGKIIARCSGRMEFGLRALGNRSIMADPRHYNTIRKINDAIKFRDFWMPFTPSILEEREKDYIVNPKGVKSSFMTLAFDSTELARRDLVAALHPADLTVRPQVVSKQVNQEYYQIIKEFENITGVGGILNTSLNLHGEPIVLGPKEALYTLKNSELDGLLMNDILIQRC